MEKLVKSLVLCSVFSLVMSACVNEPANNANSNAAVLNETTCWAPVFAVVTNSEKCLLKLSDWTGGSGTKPNVPADSYVGLTGLTNLSGAIDIRGKTGSKGDVGPGINYDNAPLPSPQSRFYLWIDSNGSLFYHNSETGIDTQIA